MSGPYDFWRAKQAGQDPPLAQGQVHGGFWRMRETRNGPMIGLATWPVGDDGHFMMAVGPEAARICDAEFAESRFPFAAKNPISEALYREWRKSGVWLDAPTKPASDTFDGVNFGDDEAFETLKREIDSEDLEIKRFLRDEITTQEQADKATNWQKALTAIESRRKVAFKAEKDPTLEASRAVDQKWNPLRDSIETLKGSLVKAQSPFLLAKAKAAREAAEKAEAERKRQFEAGQPVEKVPSAVLAAPRSGSMGGRKTRVVEVTYAEIEDYDKCLAALKTHPELRTLVQALADRAAVAKVPLDGVVFKTKDEVRT